MGAVPNRRHLLRKRRQADRTAASHVQGHRCRPGQRLARGSGQVPRRSEQSGCALRLQIGRRKATSTRVSVGRGNIRCCSGRESGHDNIDANDPERTRGPVSDKLWRPGCGTPNDGSTRLWCLASCVTYTTANLNPPEGLSGHVASF